MLRLHHKKEIENRKQLTEDFGFLLGVYWELDDLSKPVQSKPKYKQDKVMLPLAVSIATSGMNPKAFSQVIDDLKKKAYAHNKNVQSGEDNANALSKEEFISMFNDGIRKTHRK